MHGLFILSLSANFIYVFPIAAESRSYSTGEPPRHDTIVCKALTAAAHPISRLCVCVASGGRLAFAQHERTCTKVSIDT